MQFILSNPDYKWQQIQIIAIPIINEYNAYVILNKTMNYYLGAT